MAGLEGFKRFHYTTQAAVHVVECFQNNTFKKEENVAPLKK